MSNDCIKRSDVMEAVSVSCRTCLARNIEDCKKCSVLKLRELINVIPSVDRPTWIPCSERLPDEDTEVLVVDYNEAMQVCSVTSYKGMPVWEDVYGYWHGIEVFDAWRPLPESYKRSEADRPRGEWIDISEWYSPKQKCSICEGIVEGYGSNFCPNCGADMRGINNAEN